MLWGVIFEHSGCHFRGFRLAFEFLFLRCASEVPEAFFRYHSCTPQVFLRHSLLAFLRQSFDTPRVFLRYRLGVAWVLLSCCPAIPCVVSTCSLSIPWVCCRYSPRIPQLFPQCFLSYSSGILQASIRYSSDIPQLFLRCSLDIPSIFLRYSHLFLRQS